MGKKPEKRKAIAFFVDSLNSGYQIAVWHGIVDRTRTKNINLYCFMGDMIKAPAEYNAERNILYDFISKNRIDGILVLSGTVGMYITLDEMNEFCKKYGLPVVSIGLAVKGIPSIVVDNYNGMYTSVLHLVTEHKYKKIAFLHKQEDHQEGIQRFDAYKDVLEHNNIPYNPDLVVPGSYYAHPLEQVSLLLDKRKVDIEAIVAFDDFTAIPVMKALYDRDISVPDDIAIIGFDDVSDSEYLHPPLTTVRQPLYEQGMKSVDMIYNILYGKECPERVYMPAPLIVRQSCGCLPDAILHTTASELVKTDESLLDILDRKYDDISNQMIYVIKELQENINIDLIHSLLDAFINEVKNNFDGTFISYLDRVSRYQTLHGGKASTWNRIISVLYKNIMPNLHKNKYLINVEDIWQQCRIIISELAQRSQGFIRLEEERQAFVLRNLNYRQVTSFNLDELIEVTVSGLPETGIKACYLSLYIGEVIPPKWSRMIMAFDEKGNKIQKKKSVKFQTIELVPDGFLPDKRQYSQMILPLHIRDEHLGFVLFEIGPLEGAIYEKLHTQLGTALKQVLLLEDRKKAEKALARYAKELEKRNEELQQFAYMTSHDLQEPLRMVTNYLQLIDKRYIQNLDDKAHEFIAFAVDGAYRMKNLIDDLLQYSRVGTSVKPFKQANCEVLVAKAISNLHVAIEESKAVIIKDKLPVVLADETQLMQLFQNLIGNAIKFKSDKPPEIRIKVKRKEKKWQFSIKDNGIGIDPQYEKRIFMIFQRLNSRTQYTGTGIGLAICKKIIERHGGEIWLDKASKKGARFNFTLPVMD